MKIKLHQLAKELIGVTTAAEMCGCSPEWIRSLMKEGRLESIKIDGRNLTFRSHVTPFLTPTDPRNKRRGLRERICARCGLSTAVSDGLCQQCINEVIGEVVG